jgi:hypothetical protein
MVPAQGLSMQPTRSGLNPVGVELGGRPDVLAQVAEEPSAQPG